MATVYITEYETQPIDSEGKTVPTGVEPALAYQTVAIGGASAQSSALQTNTRFVRIHTDAICSIKFGANPTAVATQNRMAANQTEFFGVRGNTIGGIKIAVISNT